MIDYFPWKKLEWGWNDTIFLGAVLLGVIAFTLLLPYDALFYRGDMTYFNAVEYAVRHSLQLNQLPLWNIFYAEPLVANPQAMVFYPTHALLRFLPIPAVFTIDLIFHIWLAISAAYVMLRDWQFSRIASISGALTTGASSIVIAHAVVGHIAQIPIFAWAFIALIFYRRLLYKFNTVNLLVTVFSSVCILLSGHTQYSLIGFLIPGSYFIYFVLTHMRWKSLLRALLISLLIGVLSIGILAVQILPTLEYFPETTRVDGFSYESATAYSLDPISLLNIFVPFAPAESLLLANIFQETTVYTHSLFVGLAFVAIMAASDKHKFLVRFFNLFGLFWLIVAMGRYTPLALILYRILPIFRAPSRFILALTPTMAFLSAIGIDTLLTQGYNTKSRNAFRRTLAASASIWLILLALAWYLNEVVITDGNNLYLLSFLVHLFVLIMWIGILTAKRFQVPHNQWVSILVAGIALDVTINAIYLALWPLFALTWPSAADSYTTNPPIACIADEVSPEQVRLLQLEDTEPTPLRIAASYGIPGIQSYSANLVYVSDLMELEDQHLLSSSFQIPSETSETSNLIRWVPRAEACGIALYEHEENLPRVYMVSSLTIVDEQRSSSLQQVSKDDFDPLQTVVVSAQSDDSIPLSSNDNPVEYSADISSYTPDMLTVDVETSQPAMLVIAEPYYPGWQASVDGESTDIWRVNHALRGVWVEEGQHQIEMVYDPDSFRTGARISLGTLGTMLIGVMISVAVHFRRRRSN